MRSNLVREIQERAQPFDQTHRARKAFSITEALKKIEVADRAFPKAALFQLAEEGFTSPFEQLVACLISIRTYDEVTLPTARCLFAEARTAEAMAKLSVDFIDKKIHACTFHYGKAQNIQAIATRVVKEWNGKLPCNREALLSLKGVGPKCAELVLGIACGIAGIGVDTHVHRITNRWGYVDAKTPEKTLAQLRTKLQRRDWTRLNRLLVPFGKNICTPRLPRCSQCPVLSLCAQVGVEEHR